MIISQNTLAYSSFAIQQYSCYAPFISAAKTDTAGTMASVQLTEGTVVSAAMVVEISAATFAASRAETLWTEPEYEERELGPPSGQWAEFSEADQAELISIEQELEQVYEMLDPILDRLSVEQLLPSELEEIMMDWLDQEASYLQLLDWVDSTGIEEVQRGVESIFQALDEIDQAFTQLFDKIDPLSFLSGETYDQVATLLEKEAVLFAEEEKILERY